MTLASARALDREGRIEAAASPYEAALASQPADLEGLIDLAVLYWQSTEYGFWKGSGLHLEFVETAAKRFPELLAQARRLHPDRPEPRFWSQYTAWADLGTPVDRDELQAMLLAHPGYLEPVVFLYPTSEGSQFEGEATELLRACLKTSTTRSRYVASVIESALKRKTRAGS